MPVRVARGVLESADADLNAVVLAAAVGSAGSGFLGRLDDAAELHRRGVAVATEHATEVPWGRFQVDVGACLAELACGWPAAAEAISDAGYRRALAADAPMMVSSWALFGGIAALSRGHLDEAERLLEEALAGFERNDIMRLTRCCAAASAAVAALRGDPVARVRMAHADSLDHPSNRIFAPWLETWRAWTAYAGRDLRAAGTAMNRAATLARDAAMPAVGALAHLDLARIGYRPDPAALAAIDHPLAELAAATVDALAAEDGARELCAAATALRERGLDLHAAEAFTVAARRHRRHFRPALAGLAEANAARLLESCPGARTPLLRPEDPTGVLSPREREVLLLAADHTSAEIAARLRLAVPTVNNNLARAYAKLGISGRTQLRELLGTNRPSGA